LPESEIGMLVHRRNGVLYSTDDPDADRGGHLRSLPGAAPGTLDPPAGAQRRRGLYLRGRRGRLRRAPTPCCWLSWSSSSGRSTRGPRTRWRPRPTRWPGSTSSPTGSRTPTGHASRSSPAPTPASWSRSGPRWRRARRASARSLLRELRVSLQNADASPGAGQVLYDQGLTRMHEEVSDARRLRLLEAT
jgi:hypothetical protein